MTSFLLLAAAIILLCIIANKFSYKFGMPALLLFMALGMIFGSDGLFKIHFESFDIAENVCTIGLIFIMFYGGFCVKWKTAKPVAAKSIILSTLGVVFTALLTAVFCYFALGLSIAESFLIGAVISSTDAASVFSILRSKKLNLRDGTASLLEIESGSNDPAAYMLTIIGIQLVQGGNSSLPYMIFAQLVYGVTIGVLVALAGIWILRKLNIVTEGLDTIFVIALALTSYALPVMIGGNGFLSVYITGIILGNSKIRNKTILVHFFDGITGLAQIVLFFLLGLLSFPHKLISVLPIALAIAIFMLFIARPVAVFALLKPFRSSTRQCLLVSWAGLRGAASIVFSIMVIAGGVPLECDLFHIVFLVSLLSVAIQGSLLPFAAEKLKMVDNNEDIRKTFNDYQEESAITLMRMYIPKGHNWQNRTIGEVNMPTGSLAIMIKRDGETIIPRGDTVIHAEDSVILSVPEYKDSGDANLEEVSIDKNHKWCDKSIEELNLPDSVLIAMVRRGDENIIPRGHTTIHDGDIVVLFN